MPACSVTLACLSDPPDTSKLERCTDADAARAIALMSARLVRRRRVLAGRHASGAELERLLGSVRRLHNPHLTAYSCAGGIVLCEPFCARPSVVMRASPHEAHELVKKLLLGRSPPADLVAALSNYGREALELAVKCGVHALIVPRGRPFSQCSPSVASLVPDIDRWQAPPAGLFVLEERLLLLRPHALRMAAAHEFAHALDAVLARQPRSYFSFENHEVREAFARATGFVNQYAASGLDEYFAECVRAYVEVNDDRSSWLPLTRHDLFVRDPRMFAVIEGLFQSRLKEAATAKSSLLG